MQKIFVVLMLIISCSLFAQDSIKWNKNIEDALKLGKEKNKQILIYFGMDKCVPCRMIKKYAFDEQEFIEYSKKYIMVKVYDDLDKTNVKNQNYYKNSKELYGIKSVPTIVVFKRDGTKSSFFAYIKKPKDLIDQIEALNQ